MYVSKTIDMNLKAGDKLKCINVRKCDKYITLNKEYIYIEDYDSTSDYRKRLIYITDDRGKRNYYVISRFELVEETKQTNNMQPKVGDKVEIIMKGNHQFNVGDIGIITELKDDDGDYVVDALDGSDNWDYVKEYNLKLVEEPIRKHLGWKVIKGFPGMSKYNLISVKSRYDFATNSGVEEQLQPHLYPDIFEPVYEEEKKKEMMKGVMVGNPEKSVLVYINGEVTWNNQVVTTIDKLKEVHDYMTSDDSEYFFVDANIERIWVGCKSEGTSVDKVDIKKVIETYNELKAQ